MSDLITLTIDSVAYGGKGIGRREGKVWFVPDTVEGDQVDARIVSEKERYGEAEVERWREPSPLREPPRCVYADTCGGCQWMGISYDRQLSWKVGFVESSLKRIGKLADEQEIAVYPSPHTYGYRGRVLLRCRFDDDGRPSLGFFKRARREIIPISRCEIAGPRINELISTFNEWRFPELAGQGIRLELQDVATNPPRLVVTVYPGAKGLPLDHVTRALNTLDLVEWAGAVFQLSKAPVVPYDHDEGLTYWTIPGQFQQVNLEHNRSLRHYVRDKVETLAPDRVLDVFCGSGNLSFPLADGRRYVEGVESNKKSIIAARHGIEKAGLERINLLAGDAEKHLWKCYKGGENFDLILVDPPREGMYKALAPVKGIAPAHILYVSCNPTTLARDIGHLCRNDQYRVVDIAAFDFFPHTFHIETVVLLELQEETGS